MCMLLGGNVKHSKVDLRDDVEMLQTPYKKIFLFPCSGQLISSIPVNYYILWTKKFGLSVLIARQSDAGSTTIGKVDRQ